MLSIKTNDYLQNRMKKILSFLLLLLCSQFTYSAKHVLFAGVPMGGPKEAFYQKIQKKGFQRIPCPECVGDSTTDKEYFWGTFRGFSNSIVQVSGFRKDANNVDKVIVMLDACNSWRALYDYYAKIKQSLAKEYGQPKECREMFHINGQPKTDSDLFIEVKQGNCEYVSIFSSKRGAIMVSIVYLNQQARVLVTHIDKGTVDKTYEYNKPVNK